MLQLEVLVLELVAVDGLASSAVSSGEVATLAHEVGDDTVEGGSLEAVSLLAGAQGAEVLIGLGDDVSSQLKLTIGVEISSLFFTSCYESTHFLFTFAMAAIKASTHPL